MKKIKILVVDDEQAVCNSLNKFLTKKGYDATIALSGEEAIAKVKEKKPQIVLLDIKMPGMNGIEALKKIKKIDKTIGVIMITAVKNDEIGRECIKLGAFDYITKPISLEYLETNLLIKLLDFKKPSS